jgi:hypothetical protein
MRRTVLNIMATTGITMVVLSMVALCYDASFICISTVFQSLGLNTIIFAGIFLLNQIDFQIAIAETFIKVLYVIALVIISGVIFGWYENVSIFVLVGMSMGILAICVFLDALNIKGEVKEINVLIEQLNASAK